MTQQGFLWSAPAPIDGQHRISALLHTLAEAGEQLLPPEPEPSVNCPELEYHWDGTDGVFTVIPDGPFTVDGITYDVGDGACRLHVRSMIDIFNDGSGSSARMDFRVPVTDKELDSWVTDGVEPGIFYPPSLEGAIDGHTAR